MKNKIQILILFLLIFFTGIFTITAQPTRMYPPKKDSKIESVNQFVDHSFDLYNKVFVYDSLTQKGVEIPPEYEDIIIEDLERNADSLYQIFPVVLDEMNGEKLWVKAKAILNLNKARNALTYSIKTAKKYTLGEATEPEEEE